MTIQPMLYRMFDNGQDPYHYGTFPVGAVRFFYWKDLNTGPDQFRWEAIHEMLAQEAKHTVTVDGKEIPKPVHLFVSPYDSNSGNEGGWPYGYYDMTPSWVYRRYGLGEVLGGQHVGHVMPDGAGGRTSVPAYDSEGWRDLYYDFWQAMALEFDGHPQIAGLVLGVGLDGETQPTKGGAMEAIRGTRIERGFGIHVPNMMEACAAVWRRTQLFLNVAPGGNARRPWAEEAMELGIGLKHSGLLPDHESYTGYGGYVGSFDMIEEARDRGHPVWLESAYGYMSAENVYWMLLNALDKHPVAMDLHDGLFDIAEPEWLAWASRYLGVTPETTPDVWTVLRDSEHEPQMWGEQGVGGHEGDWTFWLRRMEGVTILTREELRKDIPNDDRYRAGLGDYRARQVGKLEHGVTFKIEPAYAEQFQRFLVTIEYLGYTGGVQIYSNDILKSVRLGGEAQGWGQASIEAEFQFEYFTINPIGNYSLYLHKVTVQGIPDDEPEPEPEEDPWALLKRARWLLNRRGREVGLRFRIRVEALEKEGNDGTA